MIIALRCVYVYFIVSALRPLCPTHTGFCLRISDLRNRVQRNKGLMLNTVVCFSSQSVNPF